MNQQEIRILISTGERSGDEHGAAVLSELRKLAPKALFHGAGGSALRGAGVEIIVDIEKSASVMGFGAVISKLPLIWSAFKRLTKELEEWNPDLLLIIDYPDFNMRLAKKAAERGIPVLYYIPPKLWAWRAGRVKWIKGYVTHCCVIYPHEVAYLKRLGYEKVSFVGHPFTSDSNYTPPSLETKRKLKTKLGLAEHERSLVIFPGSRGKELENILPVVFESYRKLQHQVENLRAVVALAHPKYLPLIKRFSQSSDRLIIADGDSLDALRAADVGLLKSGTCNLQAALLELPSVMCFRLAPITRIIARKLITIKEYSPVNIIRSGTIPECVQERCTAEKIVQELLPLFNSDEARNAQIAALRAMREALIIESQEPAPMTVARKIGEILGKR